MMAKVVINDVLEELSEENDRLLRELRFSQKCIQFLEKYRKCLVNLSAKCSCGQTVATNRDIQSLDDQYNTYHTFIDNIVNKDFSDNDMNPTLNQN